MHFSKIPVDFRLAPKNTATSGVSAEKFRQQKFPDPFFVIKWHYPVIVIATGRLGYICDESAATVFACPRPHAKISPKSLHVRVVTKSLHSSRAPGLRIGQTGRSVGSHRAKGDTVNCDNRKPHKPHAWVTMYQGEFAIPERCEGVEGAHD